MLRREENDGTQGVNMTKPKRRDHIDDSGGGGGDTLPPDVEVKGDVRFDPE